MQSTVTAPADTTQCPTRPWCVINHSDPREDDDYHYSAQTWTGPYAHTLEILSTGQPVVSLGTGTEPQYLDLGELGALLADLTVRYAELAAEQTGANGSTR